MVALPYVLTVVSVGSFIWAPEVMAEKMMIRHAVDMVFMSFPPEKPLIYSLKPILKL
jgi:hypothetical protein